MRAFLAVGLVLLGATPAVAQNPPAKMNLYPRGEIEWKEGPASLPRGTKMAILEGDPAQPGFFTMRLKFPAKGGVANVTYPFVFSIGG